MVMLVNATTTVVSHASYNTNAAISIVNVTAMREANPDIVRARLQKQVIRGAVFAFGIPPSDDPLCVSRDYRTLEEFDMMPAVLFPPWQDRFETLASSRQIAVQDPPLRKRIFNKNTP
jgi:hypothetical protein